MDNRASFLARIRVSARGECVVRARAVLLGSHAPIRAALADLLALIFHYDAREILQRVESHAVLARYGARDVVRRIAFLLLDAPNLDSESFKAMITTMKEGSDLRSRDLFLPSAWPSPAKQAMESWTA